LPQPTSARSETESAATKAEAEDTRERSEIDMGELPPPAVAGYRGR